MKNPFSVIFLLLVVAAPARAQENVVLPDLAPRVVEITGDLTISFPSLDRQPLVGFNPPPRVPEIPASRQPFTEAYKQSKNDLPSSPLREPVAPRMTALSNRQPLSGMVEIGAGRYFERFLRANISAPLNQRTTLLLSGQYAATDGHAPFSSTPDAESDDKTEFLKAGLRRVGTSLELGFDAGFERRAYSLFGAVPVAVSPALIDPDRKVQGVNARAWLSTRPGADITGRLSVLAEYTSVETNLYNPVLATDPLVDRAEDHLLVEGTVGFPIYESRFIVDGHVSFQGFDTDGFPGRTVPSGSVAGLLRWQQSELFTVDAGLRIIAFDALGQAANGADRTLMYLAPDFELAYSFARGTQLVVSNKPEVSRESMRDLYILNPYIEDKPNFQPVLTPTHFRSGIRFSSELFQAQAGVGWQDVKNYRFVENASVPINGFGEGFLTVNYQDASIFYVDALVGATLTPGLQANLEIAVRRGHLDDEDEVIPYFSPVTSTASLLANLLSDRLLLKVQVRGESSRFTDRKETSELGSLLLMTIEGTWYLNAQMGIVAGIRDLGSSAEFWENYLRETSVFYAGARWRW